LLIHATVDKLLLIIIATLINITCIIFILNKSSKDNCCFRNK
jgi:hypothetical protein